MGVSSAASDGKEMMQIGCLKKGKREARKDRLNEQWELIFSSHNKTICN